MILNHSKTDFLLEITTYKQASFEFLTIHFILITIIPCQTSYQGALESPTPAKLKKQAKLPKFLIHLRLLEPLGRFEHLEHLERLKFLKSLEHLKLPTFTFAKWIITIGFKDLSSNLVDLDEIDLTFEGLA